MIRLLLFIFLYLSQIVQGTSGTNTTSSSCPPPDASSRSIWSILGSCALTMLICIWQAIHPDVPPYEQGWNSLLAWCRRLVFGIITFIAPELVVCAAAEEWRDVQKGYEWSMTHSYFAQMGGFVYCDDEGSLRTIDSHEFLELCEANKIANALITIQEIEDKSKADAVGKVILAFQLLWFTLQVSVRHFSSLTVTLVELDTVCMAVLFLLLVFFWGHKPLCPECPHIFYSHQRSQTDSAL
ncbi:hypothetical protein HD554DRAFT_2031830 [Boletus coccyginus]|nr:hypothetical protein HD554DRAFT_2031830 [Boletus coccyginus]